MIVRMDSRASGRSEAAWWRAQLADHLDQLADRRLLDIGYTLGRRPAGAAQFSPHAILHWAHRRHLRYRVRTGGPAGQGPEAWVDAGPETLCVARAATWKRRHARSPVHLAKVVVGGTHLQLYRNEAGEVHHFRRQAHRDLSLPERYEVALRRCDHRRECRLRAVITEILIAAEELAAAPAEPDPARARFEAVLAYLEEHLTAEHDRASLAARFGCHSSQLSRWFRRYAGTGLVDWLRNRRLAAAVRLLRASEASVGEIAIATGFTSATYFIRCFRRAYGASPQRWRDQARSIGVESTVPSP